MIGTVSGPNLTDKLDSVIGPASNQLEKDINLEKKIFESEQIQAQPPKPSKKCTRRKTTKRGKKTSRRMVNKGRRVNKRKSTTRRRAPGRPAATKRGRVSKRRATRKTYRKRK